MQIFQARPDGAPSTHIGPRAPSRSACPIVHVTAAEETAEDGSQALIHVRRQSGDGFPFCERFVACL